MVSKNSIGIITYGCSANHSESEILAGLLEQEGYHTIQIAGKNTEPEIIIINTCIVKKPTETKILYKIRQLAGQGKKLIVAGCMPEIRQKEILAVAPKACLVSTHQIRNIVKAVESVEN